MNLQVTENGVSRQPTREDYIAFAAFLEDRDTHQQFYAQDFPTAEEWFAHQRPYPLAGVVTDTDLAWKDQLKALAWVTVVELLLALAVVGAWQLWRIM